MCNWQRVEDGLPPKEKPDDTFSEIVLIRNSQNPMQWFMGWYDFRNSEWEVTAINNAWRSTTITHWATVELPGE